jgi:NAD+ synthase (glutamine-hydrolysing)
LHHKSKNKAKEYYSQGNLYICSNLNVHNMNKYGFVKVAAAVPKVKVADCQYNTKSIEEQIILADGKGVSIIVFPELSITSYTCGDLFMQELLLQQAELSLMQIISNTRQLNIISIVGLPLSINNCVINAAAIIQKGKILGIVPKSYLPNYKEFYEDRWFTSGFELHQNIVRLCGQQVPISCEMLFKTPEVCFGVEICEDLWTVTPPSSLLALKGAEIIFNLSADNDVLGKKCLLTLIIISTISKNLYRICIFKLWFWRIYYRRCLWRKRYYLRKRETTCLR